MLGYAALTQPTFCFAKKLGGVIQGNTMRRYLRCREGSVFFFTLVTHERRQILTTKFARRCLRIAILDVRRRHPFLIVAMCLLPDHLHAVLELPRGDSDDSTRWRLMKSKFSAQWCAVVEEPPVSESRQAKDERGIWQRRFYEHTCRDEDDLNRCIDYVHVNPMKHGLVQRVKDWPWSTFHRYVRRGVYPENWGSAAVWAGDEFCDAE